MKCCKSDEDREQKRINVRIEQQIRKDQQEARKEAKLLLFGSAEAGKSTFIKQMRIIHGDGYSDADRERFINIIHRNIFMAMQSLLSAMELLKIPFKEESSQEKAEIIKSVEYDNGIEFKSPYVEAIKCLWRDKGIQECYKRRREFQLADSTEYFMEEMYRIANTRTRFVPTDDDILRARETTNSITEYSFELESVRFRLVDVGGQRTERRKWIHCFDNVTAILFVTAMSEYDQYSCEFNNVNLLRESLALFEAVVTSGWFRNASVILLLNKLDILGDKIFHSDLANYFPEFEGPEKDIIAARKFIKRMFIGMNHPNRKVYHHYTNNIDTGRTRYIFGSIADIFWQLQLSGYILE